MNDSSHPKSVLFAGAFLGSLILAAPTATAQDMAGTGTPQADAGASQDIIVTAQRRSEKLQDVPISITAISGESLASANIGGIQGLEKIAVGTQLSRTGVYLQPTIRGITTSVVGIGQENNVAIYVDGFYQPNQVGINLDFLAIDQVQVLKGPQGTLFGRNATGGAILISTLEPSFTPTGKIQASYGRFDDKRAQFYLSTGLSDTVAVDVAGLYRDSNGWIRDIDGSHTNEQGARTLRGKLLFKPNNELKLIAALSYDQVYDPTGLSITPVGRVLATSIDPATPLALNRTNRTSLNFPPQTKSNSYTASLRGEYAFEGGPTLSSYTYYNRERDHIVYDIDASKLSLFEQDLIQKQRTFSQEFNLGGSNGALDWVIGAFYYNTKQYQARSVTLTAQTRGELRTRAIAAYADATYHLTDRLALTGGIRWSKERRVYDFASGPVAGPLTTNVDDVPKSWSSVTPRAVILYEVAPNSNVYASYSKGFKSGTFNTNVAYVNTVDPEKVDAYEIGFKTANRGVRFDLAGYYYDYKDLQVAALQIVDGQQQSRLANAAKAEIYGAEAQLVLPVNDRFDLHGGIAYTHARYKSFPGAPAQQPSPSTGFNESVFENWSGRRIIRAPDWTANLSADYRVPIDYGALKIGANMSYSSKFTPTTAAFTVPGDPDSGYKNQQDSYATVNLSLGWTDPDDHWNITIYGRNITDTRYKIVDTSNAFADYRVFGEPATYGVTIGYTF